MDKYLPHLTGKTGEEIAADYLKNEGFEILEKNVRNFLGEIDLVCRDKEQLVFVEVKTKTGTGYGSPEEMVNFRKRQKLKKVVQLYLAEKNLLNTSFRVDVVAVELGFLGEIERLEYIKNALEG